jgi:hypothetical protein
MFLHWPFWLDIAPGQNNYLPFNMCTQPKKQPTGQIKEWFFHRVPGQNLVPAQLKSGQRLMLSKSGVCHRTKKISGGEHWYEEFGSKML